MSGRPGSGLNPEIWSAWYEGASGQDAGFLLAQGGLPTST